MKVMKKERVCLGFFGSGSGVVIGGRRSEWWSETEIGIVWVRDEEAKVSLVPPKG